MQIRNSCSYFLYKSGDGLGCPWGSSFLELGGHGGCETAETPFDGYGDGECGSGLGGESSVHVLVNNLNPSGGELLANLMLPAYIRGVE